MDLVVVVVAEPAHAGAIAATRRLLPDLLSTARAEVEPVVGAEEQVAAARVARIGVEDPVAVAQERARARLLARPPLPLRAERGEVLVVVLRGRDPTWANLVRKCGSGDDGQGVA